MGSGEEGEEVVEEEVKVEIEEEVEGFRGLGVEIEVERFRV